MALATGIPTGMCRPFRRGFNVMVVYSVLTATRFFRVGAAKASVGHGGIVAWQRAFVGCSARRRSMLKSASSRRVMSNRLLDKADSL